MSDLTAQWARASVEVPSSLIQRNTFFRQAETDFSLKHCDIGGAKTSISQRPYAMLKAPVPSITVVKQH
jgi:hypothetical protein